MSKTFPLVVLGDFAWDVLIRTDTELLPGGDTFGEVTLAPGGSAANVAVWAARCGISTSFIGKIGQDRFGQLAEENLADERVDACLVRTEAHRTAVVAVWISHEGERSMVSGQGADFYLLPAELPQERLRQAAHLHVSGWSFFTNPPRAAAREAARIAKAAGATLSLDPGSFQMIAQMGRERFLEHTQDLALDLLFPNYEEGQVLSGEREPEAIARKLATLYPTAVIALKLDADGALIHQAGQSTHVPPAAGALVDATGAGDSFAGAYLARRLQGDDAVAAAHFANHISAWVIGRVGARPTDGDELKELLAGPSSAR